MKFGIVRDYKTQTWVVYRKHGNLDQHTHLKKKKTCYLLIRLIKQGTLPNSPWIRESARRLLYDKEFKELKKPKQRYTNRPRG